MQKSSAEVRLHGFRISAMEGDNNLGQLTPAQIQAKPKENVVVFLHGLLG